jgi:hypothetical protein
MSMEVARALDWLAAHFKKVCGQMRSDMTSRNMQELFFDLRAILRRAQAAQASEAHGSEILDE